MRAEDYGFLFVLYCIFSIIFTFYIFRSSESSILTKGMAVVLILVNFINGAFCVAPFLAKMEEREFFEIYNAVKIDKVDRVSCGRNTEKEAVKKLMEEGYIITDIDFKEQTVKLEKMIDK